MPTEELHTNDLLREQLAALRAMFALSAAMFSCDDRDEVLRLASAFLPGSGAVRVRGIYLLLPSGEGPSGHRPWSGPASLSIELDSLDGADGELDVAADRWTWANSMHGRAGHQGYIVATADAEPDYEDRFLLAVLAQHTATALLGAQQSANVVAAVEARSRASALLDAAVTELSRRTHAHELMADAAIGGNPADLARTAHFLTRLPVAVVDQFGHVQASAEDGDTPDVWTHLRMPTLHNLAAAADAGRSIRLAKLLVSAAKPGNEVLGGVLMLDAAHTAGEFESYVLERTAALLSGELAHRRALAEIEMRLRSELVIELVEGLDDDDAYVRAALLGHDLHLPHQVAVIKCDAARDRPWIEQALRRVGSGEGSNLLVGQRRAVLLAILPSGTDAQDLHRRLKQARAEIATSVGVGAAAYSPAQIPRAYAEALRALGVRERARSQDGGTNFSELGLYQILEDRDRGGAVDAFVERWLGPLIDYDTARHAELVKTLAHFLDCGGNYDLAARSLMIHRSTLRYRLRRIRDLGGLDLADVDTRLNVHVATRAWHVLGLV
jgi:DNA-binding PucR family transcriptional regulator